MKPFVLDAATPVQVRWIDLLRNGTPEEVREGLLWIGLRLQQDGGDLPHEVRQWLGQALQAIGGGPSSADAALGLNRHTRISIRETEKMSQMVSDLRNQGIGADEARDIVGRFDPAKNALLDIASAGDKLKKRISRKRQGTK